MEEASDAANRSVRHAAFRCQSTAVADLLGCGEQPVHEAALVRADDPVGQDLEQFGRPWSQLGADVERQPAGAQGLCQLLEPELTRAGLGPWCEQSQRQPEHGHAHRWPP